MHPNVRVAAAEILVRVRLEIQQTIRAPRYLILGVGLPLAIYVGYTATGIGRPADASTNGVAWPTWMMVSMAAFGAMSAATVAAAGPPPSTPVRHPSGTTISARIASAMVLVVVPLLLLGLAGAFDGVRLPAGEWVALATGLWLGALPFVALGLLLGPVLDAETGDVVLPAVLVVLAIVGGLFQPTETFPDVLATVASVVPSYHLADLGWTAIAGRAVDPVDVIVQTGYTLAIGALVLWRNWSEGRRVEA